MAGKGKLLKEKGEIGIHGISEAAKLRFCLKLVWEITMNKLHSCIHLRNVRVS